MWRELKLKYEWHKKIQDFVKIVNFEPAHFFQFFKIYENYFCKKDLI